MADPNLCSKIGEEELGYYPVFLSVENRKCVVLGDGEEALFKSKSLAQAGAFVQVFSINPCKELVDLADQGIVELIKRFPKDEELDSAFVVFNTYHHNERAKSIYKSADSKGHLINTVDDTENSNFISPAILKKGALHIAVSTEGKSPYVAVALRDKLAKLIDQAEVELLHILGDIRLQLKVEGHGADKIRQVSKQVYTSGVIEKIKQGELESAKKIAENVAAQDLRHQGKVYIVGAGPGTSDFLTKRAIDILMMADVVLYDDLITKDVLEFCADTAVLIGVGKVRAKHSQEEINRLMVRYAQEGRVVVRLKGGDPLIFGRLAEEIDALRKAGIDFEVVPGVSSLTACAAVAGIPITTREISSSFACTTGHLAQGGVSDNIEQVARVVDTLIIMMPLGNLRPVAEQLIRVYGTEAYVVIVSGAYWPTQQVLRAKLGEIAGGKVDVSKISHPATLICGKFLADTPYGWYDACYATLVNR